MSQVHWSCPAHPVRTAVRSHSLFHATILACNSPRVAEAPSDYGRVVVRAGGVLTARAWSAAVPGSGVLRLRAREVIIEKGGKIDMGARGYPGGAAKAAEQHGMAWQGVSEGGASAMSTAASGRAGGGGIGSGNYGSVGGGGGGHGTPGQDAAPNRYRGGNNPGGRGGAASKEPLRVRVTLGAGGGSGHPHSSGPGTVGGRGGGSVHISAGSIDVQGTIEVAGEAGGSGQGTYVSGSGGGSGGAVCLEGKSIFLSGAIVVEGGAGGQPGSDGGASGICSAGGAGGLGRIALLGKVDNRGARLDANICVQEAQ